LLHRDQKAIDFGPAGIEPTEIGCHLRVVTQRQGRLNHAPDVRLDEGKRSVGQVAAFLLAATAPTRLATSLHQH
jgi:hypothetical protein